MPETCKTVQLSRAGRVRTGNRRVFDYKKDYEVVCKFKKALTREAIYKEIEKKKWPLSGLVGMVLRPGIRTIARMDTIPKDTIPNGHHPEWTPSRMDTIPNGHNPEWTQSRMDTIPNGHNPEWTPSRMDTIPN